MATSLDPLWPLLGLKAKDPTLYERAFTHGSHSAKRGDDYQRLEFLGDRVLGLIIAQELYTRHAQASEGQLAARLNELVARETCADVARAMQIGPLIRLGKQARDDGARDSDNVLGDVMEALIGALYLDHGLDAAKALIIKGWLERLNGTARAPKHPKSALLEWAAANKRKPPEYHLVKRSGPDHAPRFHVEVSVNNVGTGTGEGASKQEAETLAAADLMRQVEVSR